MFPYNAQQRQQPEAGARPEAHPNVQYHYSPQAQAAQQQPRQAAAGQQVQQPQGHFYPQQYPYYQQDPSKAQAPAQAQAPAGGAATGTAAAGAAAGAHQPQVQMAGDQQYMQHMVPAMGYHQLYQPQAHQQVQGQSQEYPYGYRPNDYVFMMPHAAQMQVPGQASQMVTQTVTDPTGQAAPPGIKPKVSTTLWEDENTLCFQVEARGICVARREDNDMVNGTKLLNVAGMTRGRRDGLLKGERNRHVVKAGAMHLKGVWIPYDRALDFANKERIIDLLYPLFVTDIKSVLYHPNQREGNQPAAQPQAAQASPAQPTQPAQQTPQQPQAQVMPPQQQQPPQQPPQAVPGDEKKEKEYYQPQQQQYYYPQAGQDQYARQYQQGQQQYYAEQQADQPQYKEEEQS